MGFRLRELIWCRDCALVCEYVSGRWVQTSESLTRRQAAARDINAGVCTLCRHKQRLGLGGSR